MTTSSQEQSPTAARRRIVMERTFQAPLEDVWELWTTKAGIESWWGPNGFRVEVHTIELRPGGKLSYDMIAIGAEQIAFMKKAGMPLSSPSHATYTEVTPMTRLSYRHSTDFIPGIEPYDVTHTIELFASGDSVRMVLSFDAMHDEQWTGMAVQGWGEELDKLGRVLAQK